MNRSIQLAYCSIITAAATMLMVLTGFVPIGTYAIPAFAGLFPVLIVIEFGTGWAWAVYCAVSLLSVFVAVDKEAVLFFILFFGYYPILKSFIEKKQKRILELLLKLFVFNAAAILDFFLGTKLLGVPLKSYTIFNFYAPWLFLIAGNITFVIYDYALSLLIHEYCKKFHPIIRKILHLK